MAAVVSAQNLSANERVRIATDDLVARDHVRRLNALDRTEASECQRNVCASRACQGLTPIYSFLFFLTVLARLRDETGENS